jgi:glucosamine--fructose-6-phosphate aminotransferase (isomerizing)
LNHGYTGALTAAIVNDTDSPLARSSDVVLPMCAGLELSVAATKSFVTSLSAWLHVVAGWAELDGMRASIERLPDRPVEVRPVRVLNM